MCEVAKEGGSVVYRVRRLGDAEECWGCVKKQMGSNRCELPGEKTCPHGGAVMSLARWEEMVWDEVAILK